MARPLDDDALCFDSYVLHLHQAPIKVGDGGIIDVQINYALRIIIPKEPLPIHRERTSINRIGRWRYLGIRDQPYLDQETSHQAPCPGILIPHPNLHPGLSFPFDWIKGKGRWLQHPFVEVPVDAEEPDFDLNFYQRPWTIRCPESEEDSKRRKGLGSEKLAVDKMIENVDHKVSRRAAGQCV